MRITIEIDGEKFTASPDDAEALRANFDRAVALSEERQVEVERLRSARALPGYSEIEEAMSQGFELDCNLTFEGGIPQGVTGRVMAAIFEARQRANDD